MIIPTQVLSFAGAENSKPYEMFVDYFNHYKADHDKSGKHYEYDNSRTFSVKEEQINTSVQREILRVAGIQNYEQFPVATWASHPTLRWATFAVVGAMIDMVLPQTIIDNIGMYSDVRTIGWGDSAAFDVKPRDLFVVSKAGRAKRTTELHKQFIGQVTIQTELRELTVFVNLMKVLAGKESLADYTMKMVRSFENQVSIDVYNAFYTAMDALDNTASTGLRVAGYSKDEFVRLSQIVSTWNGGGKPLAIGTQVAMANIIPDNANYRYEIDSDFVKLGYIRDFQGTDIMVLPQVADWETPFGLKLSNDRIWIVAPQAQKIVKLVLEGSTLGHTDDTYANANLTQTSTLVKSWGTGVATNAVAAVITL